LADEPFDECPTVEALPHTVSPSLEGYQGDSLHTDIQQSGEDRNLLDSPMHKTQGDGINKLINTHLCTQI